AHALNIGTATPPPSKPKHEKTPRHFFKELAVFSILKKREQPQSKLLPVLRDGREKVQKGKDDKNGDAGDRADPRRLQVKILEAGVVGNLDYKIIEAGRGAQPVRPAHGEKRKIDGGESPPHLLRQA